MNVVITGQALGRNETPNKWRDYNSTSHASSDIPRKTARLGSTISGITSSFSRKY
jgi:hypothetical protein